MHFTTLTKNSPKTKGFTLVEVLVVMAIIATLLGIGVAGIKSMASSKGVSTAVPLAEGVFSQARQIAKSSGSPTRVVVYADTTGDNEDKRERYLRMMGVAVGRDGTGNPVKSGETVALWRLISRPTTIPKNTFFNVNLSVSSGEDTVIFPGSTVEKRCYVYEFNSEGALIEVTDDGSGDSVDEGQFVVQAGKLIPSSGEPTIKEDNSAKRDAGGFRIWANGRMAKFRSVAQLLEGSGGTDPTF